MAGPPVPAGAALDPDQEAQRIFSTIMSPYCPGLLLVDCTSSQAAVLRNSIKTQLRRGRSHEAIVNELVDVYGPDVLALPPGSGAGLVAWLGPIAVLITSLVIIFWWVRQRRQPIETAPASPASAGEAAPETDRPELRARLEQELKDMG